jgi:hypothetical protein
MARLLHDRPLRQALIERGSAQAAQFTWADAARRALDVLVEAAHA